MMASHEPQHHLSGFSSSSPVTHNPAAMAMAFDHHGLFTPLHEDMPPRPGGDRPWPPQVSMLSLDDTASQHELQPFTVAPPSMMTMQQQSFWLNSSRYLGPARDLLSEFCNLEGDAMNRGATMQAPKLDSDKSPECVPWGANPSVSSMDYMALERRKTRLLSMVEEVDRCYRRYCEKMRATEMSFEAVAGMGAAQVYTKLAMRAMSRHFRCLRDALVGQIRTLKKSMGESKDANGMLAAPGASKGDTPRLRVVDQCLRRQRAFQQYGGGAAAIESCPWRPQRGLPERAVTVLRSWLFEHFLHPYPNDVDKHILARQSGLSRSQVSNWFINARVRLWKPMIEEMYAEETIQHDDNTASGGRGEPSPADHHKNKLAAWTKVATIRDESCHRLGSTNNPSDCFIPSSLVAEGGQLRGYPCLHGDVGNGAVSLTLGLQQQREFISPTMIMQQQSSLMIGAEEEDVVLPYRNLMGSELLHDFAG